MKKLIFLLFLVNQLYAQEFPQFGNLKPGSYAVGYKTIRTVDYTRNYDGIGRPMQIYLWYPASSNASAMKYGDYPLIIGQSQPISYLPIFEYLASRGYVIATEYCTFSVPFFRDPLRYTPETNILNELLDFMISKSYVNTSNISAFGHGGGIQAATYLAMRTSKIKRVINVDSGFFDPRSNTTVEYRPKQLQVPFLHFITDSQFLQDNSTQFNTLQNPITRARLISKSVYHHDFTAFGQVFNLIKEDKEHYILVNSAVKTVNEMILQFLKGKPIKDGKWKLVEIEKFNQ